jgi:hypothetical protein
VRSTQRLRGLAADEPSRLIALTTNAVTIYVFVCIVRPSIDYHSVADDVQGLGTSLPPLPGQDTLPGTATISAYAEVSYWLTSFCDVAIAGGLSWHLWRKKAGFSEVTDHLLTRLMRLAVGTCVRRLLPIVLERSDTHRSWPPCRSSWRSVRF